MTCLRSRRARAVQYLALTLALPFSMGLLGLGACTQSKTAEVAPRAADAAVDIHVASVKPLDRPGALVLDGTLLADEESSVTSVVSGRVVEVFVERGAKVEAGAPLIRLRDVDYKLQAQAAKAQLEQARARLGIREGGDLPRAESTPDVATARAELALAKSELENAESLAKSGALSSRELEQLRTQASAAKERYQSALNGAKAQIAAVAAAKTTLEQAKTAADEAVVRAPFAGEIADRLVSVGEYVSPQIPLVKLVRVHPLRIELSVPQQHLQDVQPGQRVTLVVDAIPGRKFDATVRYVSAAVERNTRSLTVEAVVPNDDGVLRPGLFATARLQTGAAQRVVEVPVAAVRTAAGVSRVYVVRDGVITERVLSIVERGQSTVTVAEGLDGDEQVAIDAFDQLGDGVAVNVLPAD